jgi:hypothetical protein
MRDSDFERLLRAAAQTRRDRPNEMPFGFDTRVLADWRSGWNGDFLHVGRLLRHVVLLSLAVIALASAGVYDELRQGEEPGDLFLDQYTIADTAISDAVEP